MSEEVRDRITFDGELRSAEIVGYSDPMTAAPGETVAFKVSCTAPRFRFDLVRLLHGDENPAAPASWRRRWSARPPPSTRAGNSRWTSGRTSRSPTIPCCG